MMYHFFVTSGWFWSWFLFFFINFYNNCREAEQCIRLTITHDDGRVPSTVHPTRGQVGGHVITKLKPRRTGDVDNGLVGMFYVINKEVFPSGYRVTFDI